MISSSETIRGYTEIIVLSILMQQDDYIYNIANKINSYGEGLISITNPSLLIIMKKMCDDNKVTSFNLLNEKNVTRKVYKITEYGRYYYENNASKYVRSLEKIMEFILGEIKYD